MLDIIILFETRDRIRVTLMEHHSLHCIPEPAIPGEPSELFEKHF